MILSVTALYLYCTSHPIRKYQTIDHIFVRFVHLQQWFSIVELAFVSGNTVQGSYKIATIFDKSDRIYTRQQKSQRRKQQLNLYCTFLLVFRGADDICYAPWSGSSVVFYVAVERKGIPRGELLCEQLTHEKEFL